MGGPAAGAVDDCLRLGLAFHAWPFRDPPGAMPPAIVARLMARTLALMPRPAPREDEDG
ncbi:hypothetical protein ABIC20_005879 [Methylobacterium radiotolerans]|uniref:TetR family transcriptional regulator n=1 Tax=Methylobacterium radiotolerans TaxID=31998 RepID=A0ABV2NPZ2_9HYPH